MISCIIHDYSVNDCLPHRNSPTKLTDVHANELLILKCGFPKIGVPPVIIHLCFGFSLYKPSSYWGTPILGNRLEFNSTPLGFTDSRPPCGWLFDWNRTFRPHHVGLKFRSHNQTSVCFFKSVCAVRPKSVLGQSHIFCWKWHGFPTSQPPSKPELVSLALCFIRWLAWKSFKITIDHLKTYHWSTYQTMYPWSHFVWNIISDWFHTLMRI